MKKLFVFTLLVMLLLALAPTPMRAEVKPVMDSVSTVQFANTDVLLARLNKINAMDKSTLSSAEKRKLRREVRAIENQMNSGRGVYISVGAAIIIVILLIILL